MNAQNKDIEYFIPIKLSYFQSYKYRIPWEITLDNDTWVEMLNYPSANLHNADSLRRANPKLYERLAQKVLFPRKSCDSLVNKYVSFLTRGKGKNARKKHAEGTFHSKSGDTLFRRCVCIPATELINIPKNQKISMGHPKKYFEPKEFIAKFKRYNLDSLDRAEFPYFTIFPMDINPSFRCDRAVTPIEKAICRNKELADLDRSLLKSYKESLKTKGDEVKSKQKEWLVERDRVCEGKNNEEITQKLIELYADRIKDLQ